jgi:hypothetical protein
MQLEARQLFWDGIISNFMFLNSEKNMCLLLYKLTFYIGFSLKFLLRNSVHSMCFSPFFCCKGSCVTQKLSFCRSLACMGEHYLVLPIEHLGESVLLLQQLFQQFSQCPYQDLEVVVLLLLLLLMMDFLLINHQLRQQQIFNSTGENNSYFTY